MLSSLVNACSGHYQKDLPSEERKGNCLRQVGTMVTRRLFHREGGSIYHKGILWRYILWGVKLLGGGRWGHSIIISNMSNAGRVWLPSRY